MDFRITSKGRSSHSSMPFLGENAIKPLLEFIQNIDKEYAELTKSIKGESLDYNNMVNKLADQLPENVTKEQAKDLIEGLVMTNSIFNGVHKLTQYLTVLLQNLTYVPFQNIIMTKLKII